MGDISYEVPVDQAEEWGTRPPRLPSIDAHAWMYKHNYVAFL